MPIPAHRGVHTRTLLRDHVYLSLRDAIVRGELTPGEKLRDAELGEWLGVSRTPVREAILRLQRAGLIDAKPGRVTMVAPEDPQRVQWAQEIAAELHALAVRSATWSETEFEAMEGANARLRAALEGKDADAALTADDDFHNVALHASPNPMIAAQLESVAPVLRRAEYLHFGTMTGSSSPDQHDQIIAALRAGDAGRAAEITRANWLGLRG